MKKLIIGLFTGVLLTLFATSNSVNADWTVDVFNAITTGKWKDRDPIKYQLSVKGRDLRVYEWQSALNPNTALVAVFSGKGSMMSSFEIDPTVLAALKEESEK